MTPEELQQFYQAKNKYDFFENIRSNKDFDSLVEIIKDLMDRSSKLGT